MEKKGKISGDSPEQQKRTDDLIAAINETSAQTAEAEKKQEEARQQEEAVRAAKRADEEAQARRRAERSQRLKLNRRQATKAMLIRLCLSAALAALIYGTKVTGLIAPQLLPWELMLVVGFACYCLGSWVTCMAFWRD